MRTTLEKLQEFLGVLRTRTVELQPDGEVNLTVRAAFALSSTHACWLLIRPDRDVDEAFVHVAINLWVLIESIYQWRPLFLDMGLV